MYTLTGALKAVNELILFWDNEFWSGFNKQLRKWTHLVTVSEMRCVLHDMADAIDPVSVSVSQSQSQSQSQISPRRHSHSHRHTSADNNNSNSSSSTSASTTTNNNNNSNSNSILSSHANGHGSGVTSSSSSSSLFGDGGNVAFKPRRRSSSLSSYSATVDSMGRARRGFLGVLRELLGDKPLVETEVQVLDLLALVRDHFPKQKPSAVLFHQLTSQGVTKFLQALAFGPLPHRSLQKAEQFLQVYMDGT